MRARVAAGIPDKAADVDALLDVSGTLLLA